MELTEEQEDKINKIIDELLLYLKNYIRVVDETLKCRIVGKMLLTSFLQMFVNSVCDCIDKIKGKEEK